MVQGLLDHAMPEYKMSHWYPNLPLVLTIIVVGVLVKTFARSLGKVNHNLHGREMKSVTL